jgi:hypothetical protein
VLDCKACFVLYQEAEAVKLFWGEKSVKKVKKLETKGGGVSPREFLNLPTNDDKYGKGTVATGII